MCIRDRNGGVHLLQRVAGADEHIPEGRHALFIGDGVFIHGKPAEGGSGQVELHALDVYKRQQRGILVVSPVLGISVTGLSLLWNLATTVFPS